MKKILARQCGHCKSPLYVSTESVSTNTVNGSCYFITRVVYKRRHGKAYYRPCQAPVREDTIITGSCKHVYCTKCHHTNKLNLFKETRV